MSASATAQPHQASGPFGAHAIAVTRLRWTWPIAIVVGFPIGGLVANVIVGRIDSVGAALTGGLIAGGIIGVTQWLALRPLAPRVWIGATSVGMAVGLTAGAALVDYGISRGELALMGALTGAAVGALQGFVVTRRLSGSLWWTAANAPAWALAWLVTSFVITKNADEQYPNFGASGALVFALVTWLPLAFLFRRMKPEARTS